jgi:hypothetical protein
MDRRRRFAGDQHQGDQVSAEAGSTGEARLSEDDLTKLFGDLEEIVVSLDRLLSRIGAGAGPDKLLQFVVERDLLGRLARDRAVVGDALARIIGEERVEEIAESQYRYVDPV